jgi:hypothetical protein
VTIWESEFLDSMLMIKPRNLSARQMEIIDDLLKKYDIEL